MMKKLFLCIVVTLLVLPAATVQANVLFQQTPDNINAFFSQIPASQSADDFSISSGGSIADVKWTGVYVRTLTDDFTIRFYSDASGKPDSLLASYPIGAAAVRTDTGGTAFGYEVYAYDYALSSSFSAGAGTTYWISILNGNTVTIDWAWVTSDQSSPSAFRYTDAGIWSTAYENFAFELDSKTIAAPEPATMLLLGLGLIGLAGVRRKFKQ